MQRLRQWIPKLQFRRHVQSFRPRRLLLGLALVVFWTFQPLGMGPADATSTSSMGLLSTATDLAQLGHNAPPATVVERVQPSTVVETVVQRPSALSTLSSPKVTQILTASGAVLLASAGGLMLRNWIQEEEDDEITQERAVWRETAQTIVDQKSKTWDKSSTSGDFALIQHDFERIRTMEEEQENRLRRAQSLLSDITETVEQSSQALKESAEVAKAMKKRTLAEVWNEVWNEPNDNNATDTSEDGTEQTATNDDMAMEGMIPDPLMESLVTQFQRAEKTAFAWKDDRDDLSLDFEETKNRLDSEEVTLPPLVEETEFGSWLDEMKKNRKTKDNENTVVTKPKKARRRGPIFFFADIIR